MYQENPEETQVIVGSMNMGYISETARNRTHDLFRPKREPIPLGHSDGPVVRHNFTTPVRVVRNLGVILDENMTMLDHISSVSQRCYYQLRQIRRVRKSLPAA